MLQIEINQISKEFNRVTLFNDISETLTVGDKIAVTGNNGSGKSTFTLIVCGQMLPSFGQVIWKNNEKNIPAENWHQNYSLCSPAMELPEELTLTELCYFHFKLKPTAIKNPLKEIADLCRFSQKTIKKPITQYSSGMKQRIKLCLTTFSNSMLKIYDEPLTNLDQEGNLLYFELINKYNQNCILLIAGNRTEEIQVANRIIALSQ